MRFASVFLRHTLVVAAAITTLLTAPRRAAAQFVTSALSGPVTTLTFSEFLTRQALSASPIDVDPSADVVLATHENIGQFGPSILNATYGLGGYFPEFPELNDAAFCSNGEWSSARNGFLALFPLTTVRLTFGGRALSGVGALMNYAPLCGASDQSPPTMRLLGADNTVLASYNIDALGRIETPNQLDAGVFRGAVRPTADIFGVEFIGAFMVVDDVTLRFPTTPPPVSTVPEPASVALVAVGLTLIAGRASRRRTA
jgi:PEP-CTERM motif